MNKLSRFDLGMIIAFVVVALLGGAGWYYLSSQLEQAQADAQAAAGDFDSYTKKQVYLPTGPNLKTLQADIDVMTAQLDPIVKTKLESPKSSLQTLPVVNTVAWKHDLDDEVKRLNTAAANQNIKVPANFYFGFSRYLNTNPAEQATSVLQRQELAIGAVANILINAPVRSIIAVRRTYDEDPAEASGSRIDPDQLSGRAVEAPGGVYTAYPFEFEFEVKTTEAFRKIVNDLTQSEYVFVIRSLMVQNQRLDSPKLADLDTMAGVQGGAAAPSLLSSSPGAVAAAQPTGGGLRYLFGDETIHVRARIDLIDWHGVAQPAKPATGARGNRPGRSGPAPVNPGTTTSSPEIPSTGSPAHANG